MNRTTLLRFLSTAALFVITGLPAGSAFSQTSAVDPSFAPVPSVKFGNEDASGKGIIAQPDGKVIIFGGNLAVDGVAKAHVARLNVDGILDNSFSYCDCLLDSVSNVRVQADGKILVSGNLNRRAKVVRLNPDGSLDPSFTTFIEVNGANFSSASIDTIQPDGKILVQVGAAFELGFHSGTLFRLNTDGSTDSGFTPIGYDSGRLISTSITALALDPAGKIYIALRTVSGPGASASVIKRYNPDGTQDSSWIQPSFSPSTNSEYNGLAVQPDGALLISGRFDTVNGLPKLNFARVLPAGNVDMDFTPPSLGNSAGQLRLLADGKILVAYD